MIVSTTWISVEAMALSLIAGSILSQIINSWLNKKLLGYSYLQQLKDLMPSMALTTVMGAVVYCIGILPIAPWLVLAIQILAGVAIYVGGSMLFKMESYRYILNAAKRFLRKKRKK